MFICPKVRHHDPLGSDYLVGRLFTPNLSRRSFNSRHVVRTICSSWIVFRTLGSIIAFKSSKRRLLDPVMSGKSSVGREQWTITMVTPGLRSLSILINRADFAPSFHS